MSHEYRLWIVGCELAGHEKRPVGQVLEDLLVGDADVMRFQIDDASVSDGTILFSDGLNLFGGARKALLAVACAVIDPQPFYCSDHPT